MEKILQMGFGAALIAALLKGELVELLSDSFIFRLPFLAKVKFSAALGLKFRRRGNMKR